jgi:predicted dinucleotide-binding enzyme
MEDRIAIVGAGKVGGAMAVTFTRAGLPVRIGVRPGSDVAALVARCHGLAQASSVVDAAAWASAVFLAVPAAAALAAARECGDVTGKVVVDCTNPVTWDNGPVWAPPPEGSVTAALAAALPGARPVKAFNTFGAEIHADPSLGGAPAEVLLAGDDGLAIEAVGRIALRAGFSPIAAGGLRNAGLLEALAVLWIHLATVGGQGRHFAFRLAHR